MNLTLTNDKMMLLLINIIFGSILLYSYYHYIKYSDVSVKKLWGGAFKVKNIYGLSMLIVALGYLSTVFFILFKTKNNLNNKTLISEILIVQALIITISMLWLPLTLKYIKSNDNVAIKLSVILTLLIVGLASLKQVFLVTKLNALNTRCAEITKKIAIIGSSLFFIHTFFLDFIGWNVGFFINA